MERNFVKSAKAIIQSQKSDKIFGGEIRPLRAVNQNAGAVKGIETGVLKNRRMYSVML